MKFSSDVRLPIYQKLRDEFAAKIASREWKVDEAIPGELELAKASGSAVGTVRKAIEVLTAEGLLERFQGRGTYVRRPSFDASLFRFFRFETGGGQQVVPRGQILSRESIAAPKAVAAALQIPAGARVIRMDRLRIIEDRPFLSEEIWLPHDSFKALLKIDVEDFADLLYPAYERYCGLIVASAAETLTVQEASATTAKRLGLTAGSSVIAIERVARDHVRHPLEFRQSFGTPDKFRYHIEIR